MAIRFKCPHCQKTLSVKDHLAGKKAACPVCKQAIKIPAPVAAAADVEDLAAAALADAPKAAEAPAEGKPIQFTCPFCDAEVSVSAELGGKQTPCPECKRIIKVPKPVQDKPKDWRTVGAGQGPSFARQAEPEAPDGSWAPATARKVSQQALAEAGAVPEVKAEPVSVGTWIRRGVYAAVGLAVIVVGVLWLLRTKREHVGREELSRALEYVEPKAKLAPDATAAILARTGEFYVRKADVKKALEYFGKARVLAVNLPREGSQAIDRNGLLEDIALAWIDLAGSGKDADEMARADWPAVQKELERTLTQIEPGNARAFALRRVINRLQDRGEKGKGTALGLAVAVGGGIEPGNETRSAQPLALLLASGNAEQAGGLPKRPEGDEITDLAARLVYAEGLARQGKYSEAMRIAEKKGPPLHLLQALLAVAGAALGDPDSAHRVDHARPVVEKAFELAWAESKKGLQIPPTELLELGRLAAQTGLEQRAKQALERLPDKAAKGHIELEQIRAQLERNAGLVDLAATSTEKDTLCHGLALAAIARHDTRIGKRDAMVEAVETLEEKLRPFVLIGVALGDEDAASR